MAARRCRNGGSLPQNAADGGIRPVRHLTRVPLSRNGLYPPHRRLQPQTPARLVCPRRHQAARSLPCRCRNARLPHRQRLFKRLCRYGLPRPRRQYLRHRLQIKPPRYGRIRLHATGNGRSRRTPPLLPSGTDLRRCRRTLLQAARTTARRRFRPLPVFARIGWQRRRRLALGHRCRRFAFRH